MSNASERFYLELEKGKKYFSAGEYDSALKEYRRLLDKNPQNRELCFEIGKTYYVMGQNADAVEFLKKAAREKTDDGNSQMLLAKIHWLDGEHEQVIRELREVVVDFPDNSDAHFELGIMYESLKDYTAAIGEFNKALQHGLDNADIHYRMGKMYLEAGENLKSQEEFKKIRSLKPYSEEPYYKNLLLNELEIAQKKTVLESKPMVIGVTLTHKCNLQCKMCEFYWNAGDYEIPESIFKEIIEYLPYLRTAYWQGGEPFFYPHFKELFEKASEQPHLTQTIVTNGLLIDESWAKNLAENDVDIICSIDGIDKKVYEDIRIGGKFDRLIGNLELLNKYREGRVSSKKRSARLIMQTVILKSNYKKLENFVDFAYKHKFDSLNLIPTRYTTNSENIFYSQDEEALKYIAKIMPVVVERAEKYGIKLFNQLPYLPEPDSESSSISCGERQYEEQTEDAQKKHERKKGIICHWPWKSLYALNEGKTKPYGFCEKEIGKVTENSLWEIWNNEKMQLYRKKLISNSIHGFCSQRCTSGVLPVDSLRMEE